MAAFPTTVATDSDLYIAVNATSTQLTDNPLTSGATTVNVIDATAFPTVGFISIDNEIIKYTGKTGTSFTGCTRGADGTSATSHVQNSQVFHNVIAAHHNASKDEIKATEQFISDLIGRTNTQVQLPNGSAATPSLSFASDTNTGLYRVTADSWGLAVGGVVSMAGDTNEISMFFAGTQAYSWGASFFFSQVDNGKDLGRSTLRWKDAYIVRDLIGDGSGALPSYAFQNDTDTGLFRPGANQIGFSVAGTEYLRLDSASGLDLTTNSALLMSAGSVTNPVLRNRSNTDSGFYWPSSTSVAVTIDGVQLVLFDHTNSVDFGIRLQGGNIATPDGTVSVPVYSFNNDPDCGLYRIGTNNIALATNGTKALEITSAQQVAKPLQAAFSAYVTTAALTSGDGTQRIAEFDTEDFDIGGNFDTSTRTFTAPVTGKYYLEAMLDIGGGAHSNSAVVIVTTAKSNEHFDIEGSTRRVRHVGGVFAMTAGDTARVEWRIVGGAQDQTIVAGSSHNKFSGYFLG